MDRKVFDEMIGWLQAEKGYEMTPPAMETYWGAFAGVTDEMFRRAVRAVAAELRAFPTIGEIRRRMIQRPARARSGEGPHTSKGVEMAADLVELMRRLDLPEDDPDKLTPEAYIAGLRSMDEKYPSIGWAQAADDYERRLRTIKARREKNGQNRRASSGS